jgi:DNA polymerase-3 subunit gamma/tau
MTTQALYRKWRSKNFDELVGQDHVVRTLRNAVHRDRVGHAYLFSGPRGTGKTSTARILAKAVNCLGDEAERPCGKCTMCQAIDESRALDLIEIDAASNRGIDEIRKLREQVSFVPTECRYKVYVVDEVHMLTPPAFNALLKTLEEPPSHAIFILATTEPHKIPQTILSRCQRFDFRRIPLQAAISHLSNIVSQEGLKIEPAVLEFIARTSTGSLRDAISLLDQLAAYGDEEITMAQARIILGTASAGAVADLVRFLVAGQPGEGLQVIRDALDEGTDVHQLASQLVEYLRKVMLVQVSPGEGLLDVTAEELKAIEQVAQRTPRPWLLQALRRFNDLEFELKTSLEPQLSLELAFLESALAAGEQDAEEAPFPGRSPAPTRKEPEVPKPKAPKPSSQEIPPAEMSGDGVAAADGPSSAAVNAEKEVPPPETAPSEESEEEAAAVGEPSQAAVTSEQEEGESDTSAESEAPGKETPKPASTDAPAPEEDEAESELAAPAVDSEPKVDATSTLKEEAAPAPVESTPPEAEPPTPAPTEALSSGDGDEGPNLAGEATDRGVSLVKEKWPLVLQAVRPVSRSVEAILRDCQPVRAEGEVIVLGFSYDFHKKRMENSEHKPFIEQTLSELLGKPCVVQFELVNKREPDSQPAPPVKPKILDDPLVQEAVGHLGAQVVSVRPNEKSPSPAETSGSNGSAEESPSDSGSPRTSQQEDE